ncbi:MAG: hypothetical protein M3373_08540 [Gemmatimonadota bacterium]|nr:hypothetical protein [Gemmatimonadota bacterium]
MDELHGSPFTDTMVRGFHDGKMVYTAGVRAVKPTLPFPRVHPASSLP